MILVTGATGHMGRTLGRTVVCRLASLASLDLRLKSDLISA